MLHHAGEQEWDRFDLGHEANRGACEECRDHLKRSFTEADDTQDVATLQGLRWLQVDADQRWPIEVTSVQLHLILHELLPFGHDARSRYSPTSPTN